MSTRRSKKNEGRIRHAGRVTVTECRARGNGKSCAPLNRITIWDASGRRKDHAACTCGRRYRAEDPDAADHLVEPLGPADVDPGASADWPGEMLWPGDRTSARGVDGVVPIDEAVLHEPTRPVGEVTDDVKALAKYMVKAMNRAPGVGLAANQVGMPVRMFVQVHRRAAPETFIDPEIRATAGVWHYNEGCLSLDLDGTRTDVARPRRIQVQTRTLHGETVEITADEVVARILQHEIDHLDGIMYIQRTEPPARDNIYELLESSGVDLDCIPPVPYVGLHTI